MEFHYEAYTRQGQKVTGVETAESSQALAEILHSRGLMPNSITRKWRLFSHTLYNKKISKTDFLFFVGELLALLESGMGIPEALTILSEESDENPLYAQLAEVHQQIKKGVSLSSACQNHSVFEPLFISALKIGEQSGNLIRPLHSYHQHLERTLGLKQKISQALAYPIFLLVTFTVILVLMFIFVVPNFVGMYDDMSVELPFLTTLLLSFVEHLPVVLLVFSLALSATVLSIRYTAIKPGGRELIDSWKERIPLIGSSYRAFTYWQFSQSLATLLNGGSNLLPALRTACEINSNKYFVLKLNRVLERVSNGESLSSALGEEGCYPKRSSRMIAVGEQASNIEGILLLLAKYFERQLDDKVKKLSSIIEPIVMLLIGLAIGGVIIALYLPVFGMVNVIR